MWLCAVLWLSASGAASVDNSVGVNAKTLRSCCLLLFKLLCVTDMGTRLRCACSPTLHSDWMTGARNDTCTVNVGSLGFVSFALPHVADGLTVRGALSQGDGAARCCAAVRRVLLAARKDRCAC
jgi:hypothetical protein